MRRSFLAFVVVTAVSLPVAGCGGGGGGTGEARSRALAVTTTAIPSGGVGAPYDVSLSASGGAGGYAWTLLPGSTLPTGLAFTAGGRLHGTPEALGSYVVSVEVSDAASPPATAGASYALEVSPLAVSLSLLRFGDAWTGERYPVSTTGGGTSVTFDFVTNASGGEIVEADPVVGTATYVAGPQPGTDVLRARNGAGDEAQASVRVERHPTAGMAARFGETDVWWLRFDGKTDTSHPYPSDFDAALASAGLRTATSGEGTEADRLARLLVQRETLAWLNVHYGNAPDGTPGPAGFDVSFPFDRPPFPPYRAPAAGDVVDPEPWQFNVISLLAGDEPGVIGTAYLDDHDNSAQENDTTAGGTGALGVFCDEIVFYVNSGYDNDVLRASPVGPADLPALEALLYDRPSPGGRTAEIARIVEGLAKSLANTAAHEIGHSLGLRHTSPAAAGSIMNASTMISPGANYAFTAADRQALASALPGPGRGTGSQAMTARTLAARARADAPVVEVCGCCRSSTAE
jgi:hypothetical protein